MFCSKCGSQIEGNAKFCATCGNPIETPVVNTPTQPVTPDRQAQWNSQWSNQQPVKPSLAPITQQPKKKLQWWHILLIVLGGLVLLISVIAMFAGSNDNDNDGGYSGNYGNGGYVSEELDNDVVTVGSVIKFGSYEQDNNYDNGEEPIEWIVLETDGNKQLLLVSKYVLDATQYTYSEYGSSWKDSCPNDYLVDNIFTDAFSYQERKKLTTGTITSEGGSYTPSDSVFALSSDEHSKYAEVVSSLYDCYPTEYAKAEGVAVSSSEDTTGMSYWWVRDESAFGTVMAPSSVAWVGTQYKETKHGVRPAIWVDKNYKVSNTNATISGDMVGTWETVSGADDHYIIITNDGKLTLCDGSDKVTVNYTCYSSTEIMIKDSANDIDEFVFALEEGKLVRYNEYDLDDVYVYAKKNNTSSTTQTTTTTPSTSSTTQAPQVPQTTPSNNNKNVYGASSLDELKSILSSDFLFTEKQINCMSMPMFAWTYNECVNQGTESEIADRNTKEVKEDINDYLFNSSDSERLKIKVGTIYECDFDLYSNGYLNEAKSVYGTDVYNIIKNEKDKLQGIWGATYTVVGESGASVTVSSNDYEMDMDMVNDFFIYKIDGRYYWSFLELY